MVWARPSVYLYVTLALCQEPLEIGFLNLVCKMNMDIKKTLFFFSIIFVIGELLPFKIIFIFITLQAYGR